MIAEGGAPGERSAEESVSEHEAFEHSDGEEEEVITAVQSEDGSWQGEEVAREGRSGGKARTAEEGRRE